MKSSQKIYSDYYKKNEFKPEENPATNISLTEQNNDS
jgi:hypothetical protein